MSRIRVARIATAHGVRGLVKLIVYTEDPRLAESAPLFVSETGSNTCKLILKNPLGRYWLAEIEGIKDRTTAESLRHTELWMDRDALPQPGENEFYESDLVGLIARDEAGSIYGRVIAMPDFGASPLLEIKPDGKSSFYLPFNNECVPEIDIEAGIITIVIPDGLL